MKKIEELINSHCNKERYDCLKTELTKHRLVVFFGSGLSLGGSIARSWKSLFSKIHKILGSKLEYFDEFITEREKDATNPDAKEQIEFGKKQAHLVEALLTRGETLCSKGDFLEAGNIFSEALEKIKENYCIWGIGHKLGHLQWNGFNRIIVDLFADNDYEEVNKVYDSPYDIPSLFFLPYIGNMLITTNVELSFEKVVERSGISYWHIILPSTEHPISLDWNQKSMRIFYIHGHLSYPESLVFTGKDYDKVYPELIPADGRMYGARQLLSKLVKEKSVLFLGASLDKDRTVDLINLETTKNIIFRQTNNLHYFPVVGGNNAGMIKRKINLYSPETIIYSNGVYEEVAFLLLQLIRDTTDTWENCKWKRPNFDDECTDISKELKDKLDNFLSKDNSEDYAEMKLAETNISGLINYLYNNHSIFEHKNGTGWSICCITNNSFLIEGNNSPNLFSPLHNYPLGDTIYILYSEKENVYGESSLYKSRACEIVNEIKDWRNNVFPFYKKNGKKKGGQKYFDSAPRIRIIVFPLPSPPNERIEKHMHNMHMFMQSLDAVDIFLNYITDQLNNDDVKAATPEQPIKTKEIIRKRLSQLLEYLRALIMQECNDDVKNQKNEESDELVRNINKVLARAKNIGGEHIE